MTISAQLRAVLFVAFATVLSACQTDLNSPKISTALSSSKPETLGTVVISMGRLREGPRYTPYGLELREIRSKEEIFVPGPGSGAPIDFNDDKAEVTVWTLRLPAGRYEIHNFLFVSSGVNMETAYRLRQGFSLPFDVAAGETSYLGEFVAVPLYRKNGLGANQPAGGIWRVRNQQGRDIGRANQKTPDSTAGKVTTAVPDIGGQSLPFFVRSAPTQPIVIQ